MFDPDNDLVTARDVDLVICHDKPTLAQPFRAYPLLMCSGIPVWGFVVWYSGQNFLDDLIVRVTLSHRLSPEHSQPWFVLYQVNEMRDSRVFEEHLVFPFRNGLILEGHKVNAVTL